MHEVKVKNQLAERIKKLRGLKSFSQSEIEKRTGLKREYLSKIENGDLKNPTLLTLERLSMGLEVGLTELLGGDTSATAVALEKVQRELIKVKAERNVYKRELAAIIAVFSDKKIWEEETGKSLQFLEQTLRENEKLLKK